MRSATEKATRIKAPRVYVRAGIIHRPLKASSSEAHFAAPRPTFVIQPQSEDPVSADTKTARSYRQSNVLS